MHPKTTLTTSRAFIITLGLSLLVGFVTSLGCISFHLLIEYFVFIFWGVDDSNTFLSTLSTLTVLERVLIPALGGFLVGVIFTVFRVPEAEGEGVPQVLQAVRIHHSIIRLAVAPIKIVAAAITLASGGSAGREGPIVQIGAAIGSSIAKLSKQREDSMKLLLAAGAAAGIGGTFGAPIAGILFSSELILRKVSLASFTILAVAAATSTYVTSQVLGFTGLRLALPDTFSLSAELLLISLFVGAVAGVVAVGFGHSIDVTERIFKSFALPRVVATTIGGLLIGMIGLSIPYIHEPATYPLMLELLNITSLPLFFLCGLLIIKIIATSITIGSGGSGGVLAPALLTGLTFGVIVANILGMTGLVSETSTVALGLIGMAAVFAGVTHAPLMSIVLLYEITEEPLVLLLVATSTLLAYKSAKYLRPESVYTEHTSRRRVI